MDFRAYLLSRWLRICELCQERALAINRDSRAWGTPDRSESVRERLSKTKELNEALTENLVKNSGFDDLAEARLALLHFKVHYKKACISA